MKSFVALVAALALLAAANAQSEGCRRQCIKWRGLVKSERPFLDFSKCADALAYFSGTFAPDAALGIGQAATRAAFFADVSKWEVSLCRWTVQDFFKEGYSINLVETEMCGPVSPGVGPAVAGAVSFDSWAGETPLEFHAQALTGFKSTSSCFNSTLYIYNPDASDDAVPGTCNAGSSHRCPAPASPPPSPPAACRRQCLTWIATVDSVMPFYKANCTADATKYFKKSFVADVSRVMKRQGGPASKFTKAAKKWKVNACQLMVMDNFEAGLATYRVKAEICGSVSADVGPALAKAVAYATWKGKTSLTAHAKAMTGFRTLPASKCFNHSLTAAGANDEPQCALEWDSRCTDATPSPSPSPRPARPPVAEAPRPGCNQECFKWTTAVKSAMPDLGSPRCNATLGYFAKTFVPDLQLGTSSAAAREQFAQDVKTWSVEECSVRVADNFQEGFSVTTVVVKVCGSVSETKGVGAAVARAAEEWKGMTPLDTHARVITGFSSLTAGSCANSTMEVYGVSGGNTARCAATWTGPPGACAAPSASPPPPTVPALSPPPAGGCTQQCMDLQATSNAFESNITPPTCPESLPYFTGAFQSDIAATMTAQGVDASLIAEWQQDAKAWTVKACTHATGEVDGFTQEELVLRICGPHSSRAGGAAVTKALAPAAWKGASPLETHVAELSGFKSMPASNLVKATFVASSDDSDPLCALSWAK
ncbi:hypothetical protein HYH03_011391 [Edaphochlamys debaryana]|uniref:Uncharacterized protein n=1 Tax=Edaphochlamys debaryana TaxID=47281 RepID=A0A835Y039_9CHLO|nr:hypothetical protein HYH03_011391 [Edaphochlamys debaryana]|eukprot:KAG2490085.1 hypothetical protein HYH03_011391 [Edaphochlamys debaryana]